MKQFFFISISEVAIRLPGSLLMSSRAGSRMLSHRLGQPAGLEKRFQLIPRWNLMSTWVASLIMMNFTARNVNSEYAYELSEGHWTHDQIGIVFQSYIILSSNS